MKKFFLFVLAFIMCNTSMLADDVLNRTHPNDASYKIEGDFNYRVVNNQVKYELTNVVPSGLTIKQYDVYNGIQPDGKEVMFTFDSIVTPDGFPGFQNIAYWYYDPDIADWQPDIEIRRGEYTRENSQDITMVLVMDCSNSLKTDFNYVKNATYRFLEQIYQVAPNGNIHIGIIGFSSMPDTQILPIQPLTRNSYGAMRSFISNLTVNNGTALFYAWDKAMEQTQSYIRSGRMKNYVKSHFITFTDGIDQTSQDISRTIVSADDYYNYIIRTAKSKISKYESDVVFVKGTDITNSQQQAKFENKLSQLAVPNDNRHYERLESIDRLESKFSEIATRLTDSWQVLNCYVAPARHGRVCWTFGKQEYKPNPKPQPVVKNGRNIFVGLNGTIGLPMSMNYRGDFGLGFNLKFGVDFAYPVAAKFAIGTYMNMGGGMGMHFGYSEVLLGGNFDFKAGLLMLAGDVNDRPFIIGVSPCIGFGFTPEVLYIPFELRFGRITKKHVYVTGNLNMGIPLDGSFMIEPSITIGYHFGDKLKAKR